MYLPAESETLSPVLSTLCSMADGSQAARLRVRFVVHIPIRLFKREPRVTRVSVCHRAPLSARTGHGPHDADARAWARARAHDGVGAAPRPVTCMRTCMIPVLRMLIMMYLRIVGIDAVLRSCLAPGDLAG